MRDIMVDIETTGLDPVHSNIIQLAAVRFDIESQQVHHEMFDECLMYAPGRWWDEGTREWWTSESNWPVYCDIINRAKPPGEVMQAFQKWAISMPVGQHLRLWAKPTSFEFPFLSSYFKQFEVDNPFHYRYAVDLNSYILGRGHKDNYAFWQEVESIGTAHNALHDVLYQVRAALKA